MKIHVSENTKLLLDEYGGFFLEKRGTVDIKVNSKYSASKNNLWHLFIQGKGTMQTFWLLGHEKLQNITGISSSSIEDVFESVYEPEFLQII